MVGALHPSLAALCGQQAFYDHYAAIPRELIHNQQLALVATGRAGPVSGTCQVGPPGYNKIPALSVLLLTAPLSGHQVMINGHTLCPPVSWRSWLRSLSTRNRGPGGVARSEVRTKDEDGRR